jgi:excisionase family DNA binding protein
MPDNDRKIMTVAQVAQHFNVHTTTIQRWIQKGHFPGARKRGPEKNSAFLIPKADVQALDQKLNQVISE